MDPNEEPPATDDAEPESASSPIGITCIQCGAANIISDQFCQSCGAATAAIPAEQTNIFHQARVKEARFATALLAFAFFLSALFFFAMGYGESMDALSNLEGFDSEMPWPSDLLEEEMNVGELRAQIKFELWGVLILNALLGMLMLGLRFWAKRNPFGAMVAAACAYGAVVVGNTVMDPATITQGLIIKILVVMALYRGLKAAVEGRNATT